MERKRQRNGREVEIEKARERKRIISEGGNDGAMTKAPPLLSAPDIKGVHGNVIIDFTISAALSHDALTLRTSSPF